MTSHDASGRPGATTHVLVVEDEPHLARTLSMNLRGRGYAVTVVGTGFAALEAEAAVNPDLLVLDLGLPDMDGLEVIRRIRRRSERPIVVLSARSASSEKVAALDLGATDYVTKPFDVEEFAARLRAAARRAQGAPAPSVVPIGPFTVDLQAHTVRRSAAGAANDGGDDGGGGGDNDGNVRLTRNEWRMLEVLLRRPGRLVTARELLAVMRRDDPVQAADSYLRMYMQQLRRKLEVDPSRPRHLITEPSLGYRFQP
jgi:two-component system, OmpR family, KDP operon response regulator KdpE